MLERIQNDLFDLGADLATPPSDQPLGYEPLRIVTGAGHPARTGNRRPQRATEPAALVRPSRRLGGVRRAASGAGDFATRGTADGRPVPRPARTVSAPALQFINRLSDFLFVAARVANGDGADDVLWTPGKNR